MFHCIEAMDAWILDGYGRNTGFLVFLIIKNLEKWQG
jgi:hypothetical protein